MKRLLACHAALALALLVCPVLAADKGAPTSSREALKALNDFIGSWNGAGNSDRPKKEFWSETISWGWRFKGDDAWLTLAVKDGKYLKNGEMRYLPGKKHYQLTAIDRSNKKLVFEGELSSEGILTLERVDPARKETQRLMMNVAGDGARFIYRYSHKPEGRTLFTKDYQVSCNKEGESLAAGAKKVECVVSGGLGTIPVAYKGVTYYVCCTGCRDAFNENPEKYIKEFEARKKGRK
jgi:hypothetical protein